MWQLAKRFLGITSTPEIHPYRGYGSRFSVDIVGRVTENTGTQPLVKTSDRWRTFVRNFRLYLASPLKGVMVEIAIFDEIVQVKTNAAGMFKVHVTISHPERVGEAKWQQAKVSLPEYPQLPAQPLPVLVENKENTYGIISDIDDTVLVSNATRKLRLIYATLFKSVEQREPFDGVGELYRALRAGPTGESTNPVFYISSSHWNIYRFLTEFMTRHELPRGPLVLKEVPNLRSLVTSVGNHEHKEAAARQIMEAFPDIPFILMGDSGQKDVAIYERLAQKFPDRVLAIYIRDVTEEGDALVEVVRARLKEQNIPVVAGTDSSILFFHAQEAGFISSQNQPAQ